MALTSGLAGQIGAAAETTYGTSVTPDHFFPFLDESLETTPDFLESGGIITGQRIMRSTQWEHGILRHEGDIGLELHSRTIGLLFEHALGSATTASTQAPFSWVFTPGDLMGKGLTVQVGRPDRTGTVQPFSFSGVKVASWEIAARTSEIATFGLSLVAQTMTTGTALATAAYASTNRPLSFVVGSFALAGSSLCVRNFSIAGDNMLATDRECIGQNFIDEPLENELREYTGEIELEFPDLVHFERFLAGTEGALQLVVGNAAQTATLTIDANVRTDAASPNISGRGLLVQTLSFKCVSTNSDASAITLTFETADSQP